MSIETDVKLTLKAEDQASAVVRALRAEVDLLGKSVAKLAKLNVPGLKTATRANIAPKAANPFRLDPKAADALKTRFTAEARLARQRTTQAAAEDRQRRQFESAAIRAFRERQAAAAKATRQRLAEIGAIDRANRRAADAAERDAASTLRRQIAGDRWRFQLRNRMDRQTTAERERARKETVGRGRDAWGHGRDAIRDTTRPVGVAALAGSAAAGAATRKILTSESAIDAAEINTRAYADLSQEAARDLRDNWASPLAEQLGVESAKLLTAWTDSVKLGIPAAGAKAVAELTTQTSAVWEVPFEQVADILGTVNSILTSKGDKFDAGKLKSVANTIQHLAANQSTTPEKLLSYLQRGAGGAQVLGMSQESGLAFGSASTSLGNQAGTSGRLMDHVASRLMQTPRIAKKRGDEGDAARDFVRALGYGTAENMETKRRADPDAFLPDFFDRFNKIRNPKQQDKALNYFFQKEFLGEGGRIVKGAETYKEAVKLSEEAKKFDAIGKVWELHRTKLSFVFKQFRSGFLNILGELGKVISPMARQAGDYFLGWSAQLRNGGLAARFKASVEGLLNGLGFRDLPDLLRRVLGEPGKGAAGSIEAWKATARGFGAGIRDIAELVAGAAKMLSGGSGDPETLARWTARIGAFSAALLIASPAISVLSGIGSAVVALGSAALTAWGMMKVVSLASASAGRTVGGLGLIASRLVGGLVGGLGLAIVAELGTRRGEITTLMLNATKGLFASMVQGIRDALAEWKQGGLVNGVLRFLDPNFAPDPAKAPSTRKPEIGADRGVMDRVLDWFRGAPPAPATTWRDPPAKATVEKQSFGIDPAAVRSLIQPASLQVDGDDRPADQHGRVDLAVVSLASAGHVIGEAFLERIMGRLVVEAPVAGRPATAEKTAADRAWRGLLVPATFRVMDDLGGGVERLNRTLATFGSKGLSSSLTTPSTAPSAAFGSAGDATAVFSSSTGGDASAKIALRVPTWFGGKAGTGNGFGTGAVGDGLFGAIMRAEGTTKDGFNTVLSYGKWGRPDKPLTDMSLDEVKAFGLQMRRAQLAKGTPWEKTSSASGAFQITGSTMMDAAKALGLDPATTKFDGETQKRMATWIARKQGLGAWEGFKHHPGELATAREAMRSGNLGTVTPNAPTAAGGDSSSAGAADVAARYIGKNEHRDRRELGQFLGHDPAGSANAWCASFVNASLKAVGQGGSGSNIANSFLRWGKAVSAEVAEKGDVLVEHRGRGVDGAGGHVGLATGRRRMRNGRLELESISGNTSDSVKAEWEDASKLAVRRSTQPKPAPSIAASPQAQEAARGFTAPAVPQGTDRPISAPDIAARVPMTLRPKLTADELATKAARPAPPMTPRPPAPESGSSSRGGGGVNGGGSNAPAVNITIHAGNQSPQEMASHLQRHVTEAWGNRAHDMEPEYT
ncbi:phage tail tape measure protein [Methylobacterium sp. CM6247]